MKVPGMQWFVEKLLYRMRALLWGMLASDVETESMLHQAENLSRIEDYARQLEADGKLHQAEVLRQRAAQMTADSPAGLALEAITDVSEDKVIPLLGEPEEASEEPNKSRAALPAPSRSRSRSRRPSRRKKSTPTETNADENRNDAKVEG